MNGFTASDNAICRLPNVVCSVVRITLVSAMMIATLPLAGQVFTVAPDKVGGHYLDFHPTNVALKDQPLTHQTREQLIKLMDAEQGFAMRPLPRGTHGLVLKANGDLDPNGFDYASVLSEKGISAKSGERVVISDIKIKPDKVVFEFNGGPDPRHRWLRHIQIGMDPMNTQPVVQGTDQEPVGSRLTLVFPKKVPEMTGEQLKALIAPIINFGLKSPAEAFADTLPPQLKRAILEHQVLVGMNTDMVVSAVGQPASKVRETEGQMPFEEWIYGEAPKEVQFIRINGNRVIRVEIANVGKPPSIRTENELGDYWATKSGDNVREVKLGDTTPGSVQQQNATKAPPSLRAPGEKLPSDDDTNHPVMKPVQFPTGGEKPQQPSPSSTPGQTTPPTAAPQTSPASTPPAATPAPETNYVGSLSAQLGH
jgi:hypothetical protein